MPKHYYHLTRDQRCLIAALKERGESQKAIAESLSVNRSTIWRELQRNGLDNTYDSSEAHEKAFQRRYLAKRHKAKMSPELYRSIYEKLDLQWSPEQISGWLKKEKALTSVSHETIYRHVWADKRNGGTLYKQLRHSGKKYNKRSGVNAGRGCIPDRVDIEQRPKIVDTKKRLGDWELDTIIGCGKKGAIVSMVERKTKLTRLALVSRRTAFNVAEALYDKLYPIRDYVETLTSDNGKEFAYHKDISSDLQAGFYFAKPYHSWQRGLNEHTNGLVRQYFPKGMSFDKIREKDLEQVEYLLNTRPRKVLGFFTPIEVFDRLTVA